MQFALLPILQARNFFVTMAFDASTSTKSGPNAWRRNTITSKSTKFFNTSLIASVQEDF